MNTKQIILSILTLFVSLTPLVAKENKVKSSPKVVLQVPMDCMSCKIKIEKNIAFEKGVIDMKVDFDSKTVEIEYDTLKTDVPKLLLGFKKIGYEATVINTKK